MLQQDEPDDYVVGTGVTHSVREFVRKSFERAGLNWEDCVEVDSSLIRPAEVEHLRADASKAQAKLGWKPEVSFDGLVNMMVDADLERVSA